MNGFDVALISAAIAILLGGYGYTFVVQRDSTNKLEELDKLWGKAADDMRKARDGQLNELRADAMAAISDNNVKLYEHRLHVATTFATNESVGHLEKRLVASIDRLGDKLDRITELVKGVGRHDQAARD